MQAKLKARQDERLQSERMSSMRAEQKEREVRAVDTEVERVVALWAGRKDLRGLLASLPQIWPAATGATFPPSLYSDPEANVKKAYMQALRLVHPDKLPGNTVRLSQLQLLLCLLVLLGWPRACSLMASPKATRKTIHLLTIGCVSAFAAGDKG